MRKNNVVSLAAYRQERDMRKLSKNGELFVLAVTLNMLVWSVLLRGAWLYYHH